MIHSEVFSSCDLASLQPIEVSFLSESGIHLLPSCFWHVLTLATAVVHTSNETSVSHSTDTQLTSLWFLSSSSLFLNLSLICMLSLLNLCSLSFASCVNFCLQTSSFNIFSCRDEIFFLSLSFPTIIVRTLLIELC